MDKSQILDLYTRQMRIELDEPNVDTEVDGSVIRKIASGESFGYVLYSDLDESEVDAAIDAQIDRFKQLGMSFEWKVFDYDRPRDLKERLASRGFTIGEVEALLVLDLHDDPPVLHTPVPAAIRRVTSAAGVDDIMRMEETVWEESHAIHGEHLKLDLANNPERLAVFAAYDGDLCTSAAWVYFHPGTQFASLWGGSTLPQYRRQGLYTGLLAVRLCEAQQRGYRYITVDASPMSRPILEKHGFHLLGWSYPCECNL